LLDVYHELFCQMILHTVQSAGRTVVAEASVIDAITDTRRSVICISVLFDHLQNPMSNNKHKFYFNEITTIADSSSNAHISLNLQNLVNLRTNLM